MSDSIVNFFNHKFFDLVHAHDPKVMKISCWDARMTGPIHTMKLGEVFNHRSCGATLPKQVELGLNLHGYLSLSDMFDIRRFVITPHSNCKAAEIALQYPKLSMVPSDDPEFENISVIHRGLEAVGADLVELSQKCWDHSKQQETEATGLMAKELALVSLSNLMEYRILNNGSKTIGDAFDSNEIEVDVAFIDLENHKFEHYDHFSRSFYVLD